MTFSVDLLLEEPVFFFLNMAKMMKERIPIWTHFQNKYMTLFVSLHFVPINGLHLEKQII